MAGLGNAAYKCYIGSNLDGEPIPYVQIGLSETGYFGTLAAATERPTAIMPGTNVTGNIVVDKITWDKTLRAWLVNNNDIEQIDEYNKQFIPPGWKVTCRPQGYRNLRDAICYRQLSNPNSCIKTSKRVDGSEDRVHLLRKPRS